MITGMELWRYVHDTPQGRWVGDSYMTKLLEEAPRWDNGGALTMLADIAAQGEGATGYIIPAQPRPTQEGATIIYV